MADESPQMPRPPYQEEGILGPGGRKFIAWLLALAVVGGIVFAVFQLDFDDIADELEKLATTEQSGQRGGGGKSDDSGGGGGDSKSQPQPTDSDASTLSADGLAAALSALQDERGGDPDLVRVRAAPESIELVVRDSNKPTGYLWADGELAEQSFVVVVGGGSLKETDFPASDVNPKSLPRLIRGAERLSNGRKLEVVNATLEADPIDVSQRRWLLNARAPNGSNLTMRAKPDGTGVENLGGSGPPGAGLPPDVQDQLKEANRSAECIANAGSDTDAILNCMEQFAP